MRKRTSRLITAIAALLLFPFISFADSEFTVGGQTGAGHIIMDEGVKVRQRPYLDFAGSGATCEDTGGKTVCTISGGGGGGSINLYVQEEDSTSGTSSDTVDFQEGFDLSQSPSNETNIFLDLSEAATGGDLSWIGNKPSINATDDSAVSFGNADDAQIMFQTDTGRDSFMIGLDLNSSLHTGRLSIVEKADFHASGRSPASNVEYPQLRLWSQHEIDSSDYMYMGHNGTSALLSTGSGFIDFMTGDSVSLRMSLDHNYDQLVLGVDGDIDNQIIIAELADVGKNFNHAALSDPALYIHSRTNPETSGDQWIRIYHNQTEAHIDTGAYPIVLGPGSNVVNIDGTDASLQFRTNTGGTDLAKLKVDATNDQVLWGLGTEVDRSFIFTHSANIDKNHDHGNQANPTLIIHSATDPDSDNTEYIRVTHDQTDAKIVVGKGILNSNVDIEVPDEVYGAGWNGSTEVPTKNAVYDKIETVSGGGDSVSVNSSATSDPNFISTGDIDYVQTSANTFKLEITADSVDATHLGADSVGESELIEAMNFTPTGAWNYGGATLEVPNSASLPGTCTVGMVYMDTDATSGQRIYACESTNTWALQGDGGGGGGDSISIDSSAVVDPDFVSTGDIDFVDTSNTVTANINAGSIIETDLDGDVDPVDGDFLQYDSTGTNFTWRSASETLSDIGAEGTLTNEAGLYSALSDVSLFLEDVVDDTTPTLGGDLAAGGNNITGGGVIFLTEQADADADVAGQGQIWVNTATPNELWFTDDAGTDTQLGVGGAETNDLEATIAGIADTELLIGNGAASAVYVAMSGDATITNGGVLTIGANAIDSDSYVDGSIDLAHMSSASVDSDNIVDATIVVGDLVADTITYAGIADASQNDQFCVVIETPVDADDLIIYRFNQAATITGMDCIVEDATSAVLVLVECDSAGANCGTSRFTESVTCDTDGATDDGVAETGVVAGGLIRAQVGTVTGTPGHVMACLSFTWDD